jgi:predicted acylesterase/phospholipase RssA
MPRPWIVRHCLSVLLLTGAFDTTPLAAQECRPQRTGLVLSGGGAKGFAHIGVFKILDSLQIHPDFIVGSSIGAIAGALYASGYSGQEIDSISRVLPIADVIRAYTPIAPGVIGALPAFAVWENNGRGFALQTGSVREHEVNALMSALMLRGNLLARGDFDRLPIPLRVVGTRLSTRKPVVLSKGDLAQAVRASFAIPLIFAPGVINGEMLMDGGVSDNIPVAAARAMGADRLIVSTLPTATVSDELLGDPMKVALQLTDLLFRNDSSGYRPQDLIIRNKTTDFNPLDFSPGVMDTLVLGGCRWRRMYSRPPVHTHHARCSGRRSHRRRRVPSVLAGVTVVAIASSRINAAVRHGPTDRPLVEDSLRSRLLQLGQSDDYRHLAQSVRIGFRRVLAISPIARREQPSWSDWHTTTIWEDDCGAGSRGTTCSRHRSKHRPRSMSASTARSSGRAATAHSGIPARRR